MVDAVNHLFQQADALPDKAFQFQAEGNSLIPFYLVEANGLKHKLVLTNQEPASLVFWKNIGVEPAASQGNDPEAQETDSEVQQQNSSQTAGQWRETLARGCAQQIVEILQAAQQGKAYFEHKTTAVKQGILPSDIAILVNKKSEADAIRKALLQKNLNSVYLSTRGSVLSAHEAQDMLLWLKAVAEPTHIPSLRNAIGTYTVGKSLPDLHSAITDESYLDALILQFQHYQSLWQTQGVLPMLRRFMMDFNVQHRLFERADGERTLTDILHIGELLQQASAKIEGMANLISYYQGLITSQDKEETAFNQPRLESDSDLIKVITIHKSKGLQYPLVFLPFATQKGEVMRGTTFISYHDEQGEIKGSFDVKAVKPIKLKELQKEEIRKLYVALTRAKYATWVGASNNQGWHESGLAYLLGITASEDSLSDALEKLASGKKECIEVVNLPPITDMQFTPAAQSELGEARAAQREVKQSWRAFSYSSIDYLQDAPSIGGGAQTHNTSPDADDAASKGYIDEKTSIQLSENQDLASALFSGRLTGLSADQEAVKLHYNRPSNAVPLKDIHRFHRGAKPGTFLHNILEWAGKTGFAEVHAQPELLEQHVQLQCDKAGWSDYAEVVYRWMRQVIEKPFPLCPAEQSKTNRVALAQLQTALPEMEFWFSTSQASLMEIDKAVIEATFEGASRPYAKPEMMTGIFKGFIDLTFEHDGKYYVLDYKSNYLGENDDAYTEENIEAAILHHRYDLQFVIYLVALHRLLKHRIPNYCYSKHIGGCVYYFLRGVNADTVGVFNTKPALSLIEKIDGIFKGMNIQHEEAAKS
jgi:exodeoxyribonuclease V beta subunit